MSVHNGNIEAVFSYHQCNEGQVEAMNIIRDTARHFAQAILDNVPSSADQQAAIRKVREAMLTANSRIAGSGV